MPIPFQQLEIDNIAREASKALLVITGKRSEGRYLVGQLFALDTARMMGEAQRVKLPWHLWLIRKSIAGLAAQASKRKVLVGYTYRASVTSVFFCSKQTGHPARFAAEFRKSDSFIESGEEAFAIGQYTRALALWIPPDTPVALWPSGYYGDDGKGFVDAGNAVGFISYGETSGSTPIEDAGPDYVRLPDEEDGSFELDGVVYKHKNRFFDLIP